MSTETNWWGNLDPADDAWHPAGTGTLSEWWYFDACLQQGDSPAKPGYSLSVAWQVQGTAGQPPDPSVRGTLFAPDAEPRHLVFTGAPADFQASQDTCDVQIGESWLRGAPPRYEMHVVLEDLVVDLTLTSLTPAWKHWDWHVADDGRGKSFFAWTVAVPMGRAEGTLRLGDREVPVTGRGYRDKCWMAGPIFRHFDRWYTGRLHSEDVAIVYYVIPSRRWGVRGDFLNAFAVFQGGRLVYEVRPETAGLVQFVIMPGEEEWDPTARHAYPIQQMLEPPENPVISPVTLQTNRVAIRRIPLPADLSWLRRQIAKRTIRRATFKCLGTWEAELLGGNRTRSVAGEAISEIVYLR